jgi:transposase
VARVNDRRVLDGIFWVLRSGAPWRDLPADFGPYTTCYNRFVRWRRAGVWGRIMDALATAHDASVQIIDTSMPDRHCTEQEIPNFASLRLLAMSLCPMGCGNINPRKPHA